jgi:hypothetical protein
MPTSSLLSRISSGTRPRRSCSLMALYASTVSVTFLRRIESVARAKCTSWCSRQTTKPVPGMGCTSLRRTNSGFSAQRWSRVKDGSHGVQMPSVALPPSLSLHRTRKSPSGVRTRAMRSQLSPPEEKGVPLSEFRIVTYFDDCSKGFYLPLIVNCSNAASLLLSLTRGG